MRYWVVDKICGLGVHGVYVNSSTVDEGGPIPNSSTRLRVDSFQFNNTD